MFIVGRSRCALSLAGKVFIVGRSRRALSLTGWSQSRSRETIADDENGLRVKCVSLAALVARYR